MRRVHRSLLCVLLTGGALWLGRAALLSREPFLSAESLLALVALGAAARGGWYTRYPVILLALLISGEWFTSVGLSLRIGYFAHLPAMAVIKALLPGALIELAALYAGIVAVACYRRSPG